MMRPAHRLQKPAGWEAPGLTRVDPDFLSQSVRKELRELIPRGAPAAMIDSFLNDCAEAAQFAYSWHGHAAAASRAKELRGLEVSCHALLIALRTLSADAAGELYRAADEMPNMEPQGGDGRKVFILGRGRSEVNKQFGELWDLAQEIESAAGRAATDLQSSKQSRPTIEAARVLAQDVARAHLKAFDRWPPIGDTWFQHFVRRLGESCGLTCGAKLLNAVLRKFRPAALRLPVDRT